MNLRATRAFIGLPSRDGEYLHSLPERSERAAKTLIRPLVWLLNFEVTQTIIKRKWCGPAECRKITEKRICPVKLGCLSLR